MTIFAEVESQVRYYCRRWPAVFARATDSTIVDEAGVNYLDFFSGAGALSYGHNDPAFLEVAIDHLRRGRLTHSLDLFTPEKRVFLEAIRDRVLGPRGLDMVVQFVGPTGATAVEAALQLAYLVTGRRSVVSYEGGYHGMTDRAASVSASLRGRRTGPDGGTCAFLPYVEHVNQDELDRLAALFRRPPDRTVPGALIIEPTQGEGGARPFDPAYLAAVRKLCTEYGVILIADEIQCGVGRTGPFFSFEGSGLEPDIICLSKSLSGIGLPLAVNLVRSALDIWAPGEFTGTFRGNNLAFATATAMLERYWSDSRLEQTTARRGLLVSRALTALVSDYGNRRFKLSGKGLIWGLHVGDAATATAIADAAFAQKLIVETCGAGGGTVKLLPPLVIDDAELTDGLDRLADAVASATSARPRLGPVSTVRGWL
jgi:diaminobutyrate-2-oxoglutarate transaminase